MPSASTAAVPQPRLIGIAKVLVCLLIVKTIVWVLLTLPSYFPPDFQSDFLLGREGYFFGAYRWAFYPHVIGGPLSLGLGLLLLSAPMRRRWPVWHRRLGRLQVANVLLVVTPTGLWMAFYAATGGIACAGLACLAVATAVTAAFGWRAALRRDFLSHQLWMERCYVLLCSAIVLRAVGGFSDVTGIDGLYPFAAWLSWIAPLIAFESFNAIPEPRHPQPR
ncbi:MAG: DUF2306 domain-containing protein [Planctomycetota bacterium]